MSKNTGTSELINYFDLGVNGDVGISGSLTLDTIANAVIDTDKFIVSDNGIIKYRTGAEVLADIGGQASGNYVTIDTAQTITGIKTFSGTNLQLESSGSADATILRNTSGVTGSTSNSNTIGFNGVNNIFVSTQNRGGFILGFNNSVQNREYTLPDASGTLALVGGSGVGTVTSVGLSSATSGVTIGSTPVTTSGTITLAIATASGSQNGLLSSTDWTTFNNKQAAGNYVTTDTTQTITGQKTISRVASSFNGTVQSFLIDGASGNGSITINSISTGYAYQTFAQAGVGKFEIGIVGTSGNGSLYINRNIQTGETGASIYIKKSDGFVGINNINPLYQLDIDGQTRVFKTGDHWHFVIDGGTGQLRFGAETSGGAVIQARTEGGTTRPIFLQRDGANVIIGTTSDNGARLQVSGTATFSSSVTANGQVTITSSSSQPLVLNNQTNEQYLYINSASNREAMTQYYNATAGNWYTGIRKSAGLGSTSSYHIYSSTYGNDVFVLNTDGSSIFAGNLFNNGLFRTRGSSNDAFWEGATQSASFGVVLGDNTSSRTAFFRSSVTNGAASVWWGAIDSSGRNIPCAGVDGIPGGGLTFWTNTGGSGGGTWVQQMAYNTDGVGIGAAPVSGTALNVYRDSDIWHMIIGGASGQLRIGGQAGSGAVIQARNNAGTTRPLYLQRDGGNVLISTTTDVGAKLHVNGAIRTEPIGIGAITGNWKFGNVVSGTISENTSLLVEVDGIEYRINAREV